MKNIQTYGALEGFITGKFIALSAHTKSLQKSPITLFLEHMKTLEQKEKATKRCQEIIKSTVEIKKNRNKQCTQ